MALGIGVMGLTPSVFWRMSVAEWQALAQGYAMRAQGRAPVAPLARGELRALMEDFPDMA